MVLNLDSPRNLLMGLLAGLIFGFLLQKGGVTRFTVIVRQFLLTDFTVVKVMLTAVVVGGVGIYLMHQYWGVAMHLKPAVVLANALGGVIFGLGMALLGYCPGTSIGAIGDGSRHAIVGVAGGLVGAALFAESYPWLNAHVLKVWDLGKITLPGQTAWPWWGFHAVLAVAGLALFIYLGVRGRRGKSPPPAEGLTENRPQP